jgi:hypothetical protein
MTRRLALLLALVLTPLVMVSTAAPAAAANCATPGHAYVIYNGVYFSGYEGNYQFGIQYLVLPRGTAFQVGANGLLPGSFAEFDLYLSDTVPPEGLAVQRLNRLQVGGNCVVNQKWVYPSPQFEGIYQVRVNYRAGRTGAWISETEAFIIFI